MDKGLLTDRSELVSLVGELADELERQGAATEVVMVGGAWMLWHAQRSSTRDVDSARRFETDISRAVALVGSRHDLSHGWLNDAAAAFWPTGHTYERCHAVFTSPSLMVRSPEPEIMFVMKLYRAHPQDREDLITLWPLCGFDSPHEAAEAFRSGYPHAPDDEYLVRYIAEIAASAENS